MDAINVLEDSLARIEPDLKAAMGGLDATALTWQPEPDANSIAWLAWHMGRCIDAQLAPLMGTQELYFSQGFAAKFDLPYPENATGYGMSFQDVAKMRVTAPALFLDYFSACAATMKTWLGTLSEQDLDKVIDTNWSPPVTLGARLISIINDDTQHVGQAGYVRGLWNWHAQPAS